MLPVVDRLLGNWVNEALKFVETHQAELSQIPVAIFSVHMNNLDESETSRTARITYHEAVRKLVNPVAEAWFALAIDMMKMAFIDRLITKAIKVQKEDKRDWTVIRGWGQFLTTTV
jgi:menaquinone-dependent protoporphyrinogen IX oxidase